MDWVCRMPVSFNPSLTWVRFTRITRAMVSLPNRVDHRARKKVPSHPTDHCVIRPPVGGDQELIDAVDETGNKIHFMLTEKRGGPGPDRPEHTGMVRRIRREAQCCSPGILW